MQRQWFALHELQIECTEENQLSPQLINQLIKSLPYIEVSL